MARSTLIPFTIALHLLLTLFSQQYNSAEAFTSPQHYGSVSHRSSFKPSPITHVDKQHNAIPYTTFTTTTTTTTQTKQLQKSSTTTTTTTTTTSLSSSTTSLIDPNLLAQSLGYLVATGSLLIYTPIAIRVARQKSANGLTLSTWWLKLASYLCADIYAYTNGYVLSTYVETLVITVEATVILGLVAYYQEKMNVQFAGLALAFVSTSTWATTSNAPPEIIAAGQIASIALNTFALMPQLLLNYSTKSSGDYSPITAGLAATGCVIRLFTTVQLNHSDPLLLVTYGTALVLNGFLCGQVLYYGLVVEGLSLGSLLMADVKSAEKKKGGSDEEEILVRPEVNMVEDVRSKEEKPVLEKMRDGVGSKIEEFVRR